MKAIAESKLGTGAEWQTDRSHDLAHTTAVATEPATLCHPARRAGGIGAELKWSRIDRRRLAERWGSFRCGGVEHADAKRGAGDLRRAAIASRGTILGDDGGDADAIHFHRNLIVPEAAPTWRRVRPRR